MGLSLHHSQACKWQQYQHKYVNGSSEHLLSCQGGCQQGASVADVERAFKPASRSWWVGGWLGGWVSECVRA